MNKALRYTAVIFSTILFVIAGVVWQTLSPSDGRMVLFLVLGLLPVVLLGVNLLAAKMYMGRINRAKVADIQGKMLRQRQLAQEASGALLFKLQSIRRMSSVYAFLIWLLGACAALFAGMLTVEASHAFAFMMYAALIFAAAYSRIYKPVPPEINPNVPVLNRADYPQIYAVVDRAANALGCRGEIIVRLGMDCNAGILRDGKTFYLQFGIMLLNILSQEELYSICLHEFSHVADKNRANDFEMRYGAWIGEGKPHSKLMLFVTNVFTFFDVYYLFNHMIYSYATSVVHESEADRDMLVHGDAKTAASALLKLSYDDKFQWENGVDDEEPMFASETPDPHFLSGRIAVFKAAIEARHADWDAMIDLEILPNNASHPTKKMRFEILGIEKPELIEDASSPEYRAELQKALDLADQKFAEGWVNYEQTRKEAYLEPLARVTAWKEAGSPVTAEGFGDILSDLRQLCRQTEADELCERAIAELDENSSPLAYYQKGCKLLYRYDEAGVDLIYHAMETNHNFMEEGLQMIGQFYCMTGREKELLEYRARAQQMAQKDKDEYSQTGILSKTDKLSAEHLPEGMLEDILAFIHTIDGDIVKNIYLVRKTISETFFTSAFIIHCWGGTDEQRDEIMHKIFCYLDTYPVDWQFSLFDYADHSDIKFDKIEGSLVWTKNNDKGDQKQ
ncbi:MAG: hypothetical protein IJD75_00900 [Clostridia bacterium]|nr:hypothetical protein [Clostridia bacterium]